MKYRYKEVTEEEYEKEMMNWHKIRCREMEMKEYEKEMKKEKCEEKNKKKRNECSFASFIYERTYIYHSKIHKSQAINLGGLTKKDYDVLDDMRKNDPNMFDRMAVK